MFGLQNVIHVDLNISYSCYGKLDVVGGSASNRGNCSGEKMAKEEKAERG